MRVALPLLLALSALPAAAQTEVDIELVLAVDVSRSMSPYELEIQRRGYAEALVSDEVLGAIANGFTGRIAILYMEWAGSGSTRVVVDWTAVGTRAEAEGFAAALSESTGYALRRTSISGAISTAADLFADNGFTSFRQVIDVSGDGPNNHGRPVTEARDAFGGMWHLEDLDRYYSGCVIGGPGAFVIPVHDWSEFPAAVRRKLVLEIAGAAPSGPRVVPVQAAAPYDCLIGEKIWERNRGQWDWQ